MKLIDLRASLLLVACVGVCACSSSGATSGPADASISADAGGGPGDVLGTCKPSPGFSGNAKNVGAYCSPNGGQCAAYGNSLVQCAIDLDPTQGSNFCILLGCTSDSDCGQDACCTGQTGNSIHACVPIGCFDGGVCPGPTT